MAFSGALPSGVPRRHQGLAKPWCLSPVAYPISV